MNEIWKAIPGFPGYEASILGRIRSIDRSIECGAKGGGRCVKWLNGKILSQRKIRKTNNYFALMVTMSDQDIYAHRAVWSAFNGRKLSPNETINHIDFNPQNNAMENLEVCSLAENRKYSAIAGRCIRKNRHITNTDVIVIRKSERSLKMLARLFKIKEYDVSNIRRKSKRRSFIYAVGEL